MRGILGFAVVAAVVVTAGALAAETQISEEAVRSAIETFLQNPTVPSESARTIALFTEESDAVHVIVNLDVSCTYLREKYGHTGELMMAFVAGNIRSQLDSGIYGDDPYSGLLAVFRVYRHLKKANTDWTIPEVETLLDLHRQGKLAEHLAKEKERFAKERKQED